MKHTVTAAALLFGLAAAAPALAQNNTSQLASPSAQTSTAQPSRSMTATPVRKTAARHASRRTRRTHVSQNRHTRIHHTAATPVSQPTHQTVTTAPAPGTQNMPNVGSSTPPANPSTLGQDLSIPPANVGSTTAGGNTTPQNDQGK